LGKISSAAVYGVHAYEAEIEANGAGGDSCNPLVAGRRCERGLRTVTAAIANSEYFWQRGRTTINLAPADIKKERSFD